MKISNLYKLPMITDTDCIVDQDYRYKIDFDGSDSNCEEQIKAVAVAIDNHDALVEALNDLLMEIKDCNIKDYCYSCDSTIHDSDCKVLSAINLLDKIKGESSETN